MSGVLTRVIRIKCSNRFVRHSVLKYNNIINEPDLNGDIPLDLAVLYGNYYAVNMLLENGANPNVTNRHGHTPLTNSVLWRKPRFTNILLNHGACPYMPNDHGDSPLSIAINNNILDHAELLLKK